ncbi:MAG TPA: hypothetical protein VMD58_00065 [Acidobacteriaceae bacterium]|nr:hypothetical protein [Acidobacteriaceae bacterium]
MVIAMKMTRIVKSILPFALAGLLLASGCKKQNQPPANAEAPSSSQSTAPPPPADQTAAQQASPSSSNGSAAANSSASSQPSSQASQATAPAPPPPPPPLVIPAGFHISVTVQQALGSRISQPGDTFAATVARPIVVRGVTAIRAGAPVSGTVVDAKRLGRFKGGAFLELRLDTVRADGRTYQISTSSLERAEKGKGKRSAGFIGGGAGLGAIIGGLAGGGKGAVIGGLAGAGAGTAGAGLTGNREIVIPAESTLTFRLERPITVQQQ